MKALLAIHLPAGLWTVVTAFLMVAPGSAVSSARWPLLEWLGPAADKIGHFGVFAVLAWLLQRSLRRFPAVRRPLLLAAVAALVYSVVLETWQLWVPGRGWSLLDLLAGAAGVALGAGWPEVAARRLPRRGRPSPTRAG